ncbi:MAG: hypothetical protein LBI86_03390 [Treponema sp.]|jgi:hypothetical protein|nr:hypothetical protein [Treponema sp.]
MKKAPGTDRLTGVMPDIGFRSPVFHSPLTYDSHISFAACDTTPGGGIDSVAEGLYESAADALTADSQPVNLSSEFGGNIIAKALSYIGKQTNLLIDTYYTIVLDGPYSMDVVSTANIKTTNAVITLVGKTPAKIRSYGDAWLFWIEDGTLVLGNNITLSPSYYSGGVRVDGSSAALIMQDGAAITRNIDNAGSGSGVVVHGGSFDMNGGTIFGNTSGGVVVYGGSFDMSGGTISGNKGSGVVVDGGNFTMSGGTISGNSSYSYGGGVNVCGGSFTMDGGTISGNTAPSYGGGVFISGGNFDMSGGIISGNVSSSSYGGGGVYVYTGGSFAKTGGIIYGSEETGSDKEGNPLKNITSQGDAWGHAVRYIDGSSIPFYYRDVTLDKDDNISTTGPFPAVSGESLGNWTRR